MCAFCNDTIEHLTESVDALARRRVFSVHQMHIGKLLQMQRDLSSKSAIIIREIAQEFCLPSDSLSAKSWHICT